MDVPCVFEKLNMHWITKEVKNSTKLKKPVLD